MNTSDAIQSRAETLREMAASNRRDAIVEDERGNIILARNLRERAEDYVRHAAEMLAKIADPASMIFVFGVLAAYWQVTP